MATKLGASILIALMGFGSTKESEPAQVEIGTFEATFYTSECEGCRGITYTGYDVRSTIHKDGLRIIAVDPNVIPLNSIVTVEYSDGTSFKAKALDIGSDIKGNRIDILVETKEEAYRLGRQQVRIYKE